MEAVHREEAVPAWSLLNLLHFETKALPGAQ
jgi:hypothetical protein